MNWVDINVRDRKDSLDGFSVGTLNMFAKDDGRFRPIRCLTWSNAEAVEYLFHLGRFRDRSMATKEQVISKQQGVNRGAIWIDQVSTLISELPLERTVKSKVSTNICLCLWVLTRIWSIFLLTRTICYMWDSLNYLNSRFWNSFNNLTECRFQLKESWTETYVYTFTYGHICVIFWWE